MAPEDDWNPDMMFDLYMHDYMLKKNMNKTAAIFKREANIPNHHRVAIDDTPQGFLHEWWSHLWDGLVKNEENKPAEFLDQAMQAEETKKQQSLLSVEPNLAKEVKMFDKRPSFGPLLSTPNVPFSLGNTSSSSLPPQMPGQQVNGGIGFPMETPAVAYPTHSIDFDREM